MLTSHLVDLYNHQAWADARAWTVILNSESATADDDILDTMMHVHEAQHAFLNVWTGRPFVRNKREDIGDASALCDWAHVFHREAMAFIVGVAEDDLELPSTLPWATYFGRSIGREPADTKLRETLHQVVSHSMHHRGQVLRRLRALGDVPPLTDYIVWVWEGRPSPDWPASSA